jgi:two-component system, sensor histidine kinase PdtaS
MTHSIKPLYNIIKSFLLIILSTMTTLSQSENKSPKEMQIDSLLDVAWALGRSQPDQSLNILRTIEIINSSTDQPYKNDVVWYYYGVFYKNLNKFDLSEEHFNKYEEFHKDKGNFNKVAAVNMAKSNLFSDLGNLPKSMEAATTALSYYEDLNDTLGIIRTGSKIGDILSAMESYQEALKYLEKSISLSVALENKAEEQIGYTNMGLLYERKKEYDSALKYYRKAYDIGESKEGDYDKVINRYNMANILSLAGQREASIPFAEACARLADSINIPSLSGASKRLLADIFIDKGEVQSGLNLLSSQINSDYFSLGLRDQTEVYSLLVKGYQMQGNYKQAFESLQSLKTLNDSLIGQESRNKLNELSTFFETEKKEQLINLLNLEKETALAVINQKNRTIAMIIIALTLVIGLSLFLFFLYRKYKDQKLRLLKALDDKEYLIKEIHHRVKNNLQIISSLLQLQSRYLDEPNAIEALRDGDSRVKSMAIIHHFLYSEENVSKVNVQEYLTNLLDNLQASYNIQNKNIHLHTDVDELLLDDTIMIPIGLIVNELVTNVFKYAFQEREEGNVWIAIKESGYDLMISIKDDGIGKDLTKNNHGFGTRLIEAFIKKLNATIQTRIMNGTHIEIWVPQFSKQSSSSKIA